MLGSSFVGDGEKDFRDLTVVVKKLFSRVPRAAMAR
jgi:hypothetical protein